MGTLRVTYLPLIIGFLVVLSACTTTKGSFCQIAKPIRLTADTVDHLTDEEVAALLAHNTKLQRLCGVKP